MPDSSLSPQSSSLTPPSSVLRPPSSLQDVARLPSPGDNAAIATRRLDRGTRILYDGSEFVLDHDVLEGHRFAVKPIAQEEPLLSWGHRFGIATRDIAPGNYVVNASVLDALRERNVTLDLPAEPNFRNQIDRFHFDANSFAPGIQVAPYPELCTFLGYRRPGGRGVGTRNVIVIIGLSSRAASYARALAIRCEKQDLSGFRGELRSPKPDRSNIRIAAVAHTEGSGGDPLNNFEFLVRTLAGMMVHPNVGAVLAVSHPGDAVTEREMRAYLEAHNYPIRAVPHHWLTLGTDLQADLARGEEIVNAWLPEVNRTPRTPESIAHLKVALQCGGSDAFSGISGNPLLGAVAREILQHGGSANLGETDELIGAEEYVLRNVRDLDTVQAFLDAVEQFKERLSWHGVTAEGNPSGGNQYRGLYNISLKSLGAAMKKDPAVRIDRVIAYGERMSEPGFYFMDSPGNDLEGIAGQVAAGCNLIFFTTGNGSVTNFPFVPTIKIVTTTGRYNLLANEMDVNAGAFLDGTPLSDLTDQTFDLTVRIASGELSKGERAKHSQVSIWRNWRQTDSRRTNVLLEMPEPTGDPLPLPAFVSDARRSVPPLRPLSYPIYDDGSRIAPQFVGLILPTSLCASEVARMTANHLNQQKLGQPGHLSRFAALTHTEGCGVSGDSYMALYKRTMLNYMLHPMVRLGFFLEHGCEITHNDSMRRRLEQLGADPSQFGWASIQLDGGMERVLTQVEEWFTARLSQSPVPRRALVAIQQTRIGLMAASAPPPHVAAALANVARNILVQGGTLILPSTSPLLTTPSFINALFGTTHHSTQVEFAMESRDLNRPVESTSRAFSPTLAYGQFAVKRGLHIMDAPSRHWVETLSGLGATGVEIILAYVDTSPHQAHPFIPMLQFAHSAQSASRSPQLDLVLDGDAEESAQQLEAHMLQMLAGKITPRADALDNRDFQITRALLGVTV